MATKAVGVADHRRTIEHSLAAFSHTGSCDSVTVLTTDLTIDSSLQVPCTDGAWY